MISLFGLSSSEIFCQPYPFASAYMMTPVLHGGQSLHHRLFWLLPTAFLCGLAETLGWVSRLWLHHSPANETALQIMFVILLPLLAKT